MIGLLMMGSIVNYLTRSTLSVAAPTLLKDLDISTYEYSWIVAAFQFAIMLQPLCGYVLDVLGLRMGFAIFAIAWSIISMAHGLANNWQALFGLRALLGLAEGSANPAGMKATSEWFPAKERGYAGGVFNMGASVGSMLAAPIVAWAIIRHSWQFAFVLTGALGLIWVTLWLLFYHSPATHPALSPEERDYIISGQEKHLEGVGARPSIPAILRQRNFWGIAIPRLLADPTWGTLTAWMPLYLATTRGFDLKQIALFAWLPFLAADLGCMFGGTISHALQRWFGIGLINARRGAFTVGALMMTAMAFVGVVDSPVRGNRAAESWGLRSPDALRHRHHDVVGPLPSQRSGDGRRHGRHVRQRRRPAVLAPHRRPGDDRRLHAVLRRPRGARSDWRRRAVDARQRTAMTAAPDPRPVRGRIVYFNIFLTRC